MTVYRKNPLYGATLSIVPGLGSIYCQDIRKGMLYMAVFIITLFTKNRMSPSMFVLVLMCIYALAVYTSYNECKDTSKNTKIKRDPYFAACLSFLYDGAGQIYAGTKKRGIIMATFGLTPCMANWAILIHKFGLLKLFNIDKGIAFYIINIMVCWTFTAVLIKIVSIFDAFYTVYHKYALVKKS